MTARKSTRSESDNSVSRGSNPDAQLVIDCLQTIGSTSFETLLKKTQLPECQLKELLDELQAADVVAVETGFRNVTVELVDADDPQPVADGGYVRRVIDAIGRDDVDVELAAGEIFHLLSCRRRRSIIRLLATLWQGGQGDAMYMTVSDLTELLARSSLGLRQSDDIPEEEYHRTYVALTQTHAPLLDDYGVIKYYDRVKKLRATRRAVEVAQIMEQVAGFCDGTEPPRGGRDDE